MVHSVPNNLAAPVGLTSSRLVILLFALAGLEKIRTKFYWIKTAIDQVWRLSRIDLLENLVDHEIVCLNISKFRKILKQ